MKIPVAGVANPQVSVVLPVYNREAYCMEAIDSILAQTYDRFELILVNDGSTDNSGAILDRYAGKDGRIRVFHFERNRGVSAASNHGIRNARAPLIARMDSDDIALPDRLAIQIPFMDQNPHVVVCGGSMDAFNEEGLVLEPIEVEDWTPQAMRKILRHGTVFLNPTVVMRTDAVRAVGGYRPVFDLAEDYDLFLRLSFKGELRNLPQRLLRYRVHCGSQTSRHWVEMHFRAHVVSYLARRVFSGKDDPFDEIGNESMSRGEMVRRLSLSQEDAKEFWAEWAAKKLE